MHPSKDIVRYIANELDQASQKHIREHLLVCADCREQYDREILLRRALSGAVETATQDEQQRVLARAMAGIGHAQDVVQERGQSWFARWLRVPPLTPPVLAAAAALLLLVAGGGLYFWHEPAPTTVATPTPAPTIPTPKPPEPAAYIAKAVSLTVDGTAVKAGATVFEQTLVAAANKGLAELTLLRGGTVRLYPGSAVKLAAQGTTVRLLRGTIWCQVQGDKGFFQVRTNDGVARVLGTSFVVEKSPQVTEVRVIRGQVTVSDSAGQGQVTLQSRQRTQVRANRLPDPPVQYSPGGDISIWEKFLKELLKTIEQGVRDGVQMLEQALQPDSK